MKYRIVEKMGKFYPQYSKGWIWRTLSCRVYGCHNYDYALSYEQANHKLNFKFQQDLKDDEFKKKGTIIHAPQLSNKHSV